MRVIDIRLVVEPEVDPQGLVQSVIEDSDDALILGAQVLEDDGFAHLLPTGPRFIILGGEAGERVERALASGGVIA